MRPTKVLLAIVLVLALLGPAATSFAALYAVDPGPYSEANGFFPAWYQDGHGRALEICLSTAANANGSLCGLLAAPGFDPLLPIAFPSNFPDEAFWFSAEVADTTTSGGFLYIAALEAAFGGGPVAANDQVSFARIRIRVDVSGPGVFVVTHPYGEETFVVDQATFTDTGGIRAINHTADIGLGAPGVFTGALTGPIGPLLSAATGIVTATNGEQFIGDPNVRQAVVGSPFGTNFVRVQGPGIAPAGTAVACPGIPTDCAQFNGFALTGKIYPGTLPTPLIVERTTYDRIPGRTQVDVFASAGPAAALAFAPPTTPMNADALGRFFGQAVGEPFASPVTVDAANPSMNNSPVSVPNNAVVDVVRITRAEYSRGTGTLTIEAASSDETTPPTLSAGALGNLSLVDGGPTQRLDGVAAAIPPATITVTSTAGGSDTEEVTVLP
jgi:hypothetical protein